MTFTECCICLLVAVTGIYSSLIMWFFTGLRRAAGHGKTGTGKQPGFPAGREPVFVSVVIPARNEERNMPAILEEMRLQDYPYHRFEVLVTDDFSEDATLEQCALFASGHPDFPLVVISVKEPGEGTGKKQAILRAIEKTRGEVILFTDADTWRGPGWVSSMAGMFGGKGVHMVLGPVQYHPAGNLLGRIQALEFLGIMGTTAGSAALGHPVMCNGANLACRRQDFIDGGGSVLNLRYGSGDDQFLMEAIGKKYGRTSVVFNFDRAAVVSTEPEQDLAGFFRQRTRWLSKSPGYRDPLVIATGAATLFMNLVLIVGLITAFSHPWLLVAVAVAWLVKIMVEFPLVRGMARFFIKRVHTGLYLLSQLFQVIYVVVVGIAWPFVSLRWKGRKVNR